MKYLLDTCVLLNIMSQNSKVSDSLLDIIYNDDNQLFYSTASVWEIEIKHKKIKNFKLSGEQFSFLCEQYFIRNIEIENEHIFELDKLEKVDSKVKHNDPFDKILIAQANYEDLVLITYDKKMKAYNCKNILLV